MISWFELKVVFDVLDYRGAFLLYNLVEEHDIQSFVEVFTSKLYILKLLEAVHKQNIFPIKSFYFISVRFGISHSGYIRRVPSLEVYYYSPN